MELFREEYKRYFTKYDRRVYPLYIHNACDRNMKNGSPKPEIMTNFKIHLEYNDGKFL